LVHRDVKSRPLYTMPATMEPDQKADLLGVEDISYPIYA
jgi:hypothetical protein